MAGTFHWISVLFLICLITACDPVRGFLESRFELAPESRLPKWVQVPSGMSRADVKVELFYYSPPAPNIDDTVLKLRFGKGRPQTITGKHWYHPRTDKELDKYYATEPRPAHPDPSYVVVVVNGIVDVIEHRDREQNARDPSKALFWMCDKPDILQEGIESAKHRSSGKR
jgi:hypothetical protein